MCTKYINPRGTLFLKCDKLNAGKPGQASYLRVLNSGEYHPYYMNYCENCGSKLITLNDENHELVPVEEA